MILKILCKIQKYKYFIEIYLLLLMLLLGFVIFFQYELMESYRKEEDGDEIEFQDAKKTQPFTVKNQWQLVKGTSHKLYVYSAFYDDREDKKLIRIIGLSEPQFNDGIHCQVFFFEGETEHIFTPAKVKPLVNDTTAELVAVFVTCPLPEASTLPRAVVVTTASQLMISNLLLVQQSIPKSEDQNKKDETIAVCVEPLENNYSQTNRLLEFVELNTILGADYFIFYKQAVSETFACYLSDYIKQGRVSVVDWNISSNETGTVTVNETNPWSERRSAKDMAAFNDCLYQTINRYEHTVFLAIDEFIIPKTAKSLRDLLRAQETNYTGAFEFKVGNFYLDWPDEKWKLGDFPAYLNANYKTYQTTSDKNKSTKYVCKPKVVLQVNAGNDMKFISGYNLTSVDEVEGLCHRYRLSPSDEPTPPTNHARRDLSAHRFLPRLCRAFVKQFYVSTPHCSLNGTDVTIGFLPDTQIPVLIDEEAQGS